MGRVLHASYSGYFPYCIIPYDDSPFLPLFSISSLDVAMRLFWRVRKIRFYGTYEPTPPLTGTRNYELVWSSAADTEEGLVCNPGWTLISSQGTRESYFIIEDVTSYQDQYVVRLSFLGEFDDTFGPDAFSFSNPSIIDPNYSSINFEGVTMWGIVPDGATFNYEILEYWSYGGIYNTETGELL